MADSLLMTSVDAIHRYKASHPLHAKDSQVNAVATATFAAPSATWRNRILRVDATYSDGTVSGTLSIKFGTTVVAERSVHGIAAFDFDLEVGFPADNRNQAVSAELTAGGAGITGKVFMQGFKSQED